MWKNSAFILSKCYRVSSSHRSSTSTDHQCTPVKWHDEFRHSRSSAIEVQNQLESHSWQKQWQLLTWSWYSLWPIIGFNQSPSGLLNRIWKEKMAIIGLSCFVLLSSHRSLSLSLNSYMILLSLSPLLPTIPFLLGSTNILSWTEHDEVREEHDTRLFFSLTHRACEWKASAESERRRRLPSYRGLLLVLPFHAEYCRLPRPNPMCHRSAPIASRIVVFDRLFSRSVFNKLIVISNHALCLCFRLTGDLVDFKNSIRHILRFPTLRQWIAAKVWMKARKKFKSAG